MREVSCRVFEIFLREMDRRGVDTARVYAGTALTDANLRDKNERIDWADFKTVMGNLGTVFTRDELTTIGRAHVTSPLLRPIGVVARLLFSAMEIYQFWGKPNGPGHQLFACVDSTTHIIDSRRLTLELTLQPGFEPIEEFYLTTIGGLASVPTVLALPFADVQMQRTAFGARYDITLSSAGGKLAFLRRIFTWPFTIGRAGRELRDANETLTRQYREIAAAQRSLSVHARQLGVAHQIGEAIHKSLDLERTLETIAVCLESVAGFARAQVDCVLATEGAERPARVVAGPALDRNPDLQLQLRLQSALATVSLWFPERGTRAEYEELAEFLRPTLLIALENTRTVSELRESRQLLNHRLHELTHAYALAEQAAVLKGQFVANVSHELRTPMTGVLGMAEILKQTNLDEEQKTYVDLVERSGRGLLRVINDLLDFSKLEAGHTALESAPFDVRASFDDFVRFLESQAHEAGIELVLHIDEAVPERLRGDVGRIGQIATNLIGNAIKFTKIGGVLVRVSVPDPVARGGRIPLRIEVRDSGIGIMRDAVPLLFQPFVQADGSSTRTVGGTGLGLTISKQLADIMGAKIDVESTVGQGSRFWLDLPLEVVPAGATRAPLSLEGRSVFVFASNTFALRVIEDAFVAAGAAVTTARDASALAEVRWSDYSAIVLCDHASATAALQQAASAAPRGSVVHVRDAHVRSPALSDAVTNKPVRIDKLLALVAARGVPAREPVRAAERRVLVREPEVVAERILTQLLQRRGSQPIVVQSVAELATLTAEDPSALVFLSIVHESETERRELDHLLRRIDTELGPKRVVALVADRSDIPAGHEARFLAVVAKPFDLQAIDDIMSGKEPHASS